MSVNSDLLNNRKSAQRVSKSAEDSGYNQDDINVIMFKENLKKYYVKESTFETEVSSKITVCAAIGGALGGTLGAMIGAIAAVGTTLVLPGFGLVIAGPIAAAIAGAGAGGLFAGLVGALIGWLIPENHLVAYEQNIHDGDNLTSDKSKSQDNPAQFYNHWERHHGSKMLG